MSEYYYLVSSLPMLDLETPPDMGSEEFLSCCADFLSPYEFEKLNSLSLLPEPGMVDNSSISDWFSWEVKMRNTILQHRGKTDIEDPERFLREENDFFSEIQKGVQEAFSRTPKEREDYFDRIRWSKLENLELGHDFDFTRLCLYKLQLLLCEKRNERTDDKGSHNYDEVVAEIYGVDPLAPPQIEENAESN